MSKAKAYTCDCCGEVCEGAPFAEVISVPTFHFGKRLDHQFEDVCRGCAETLGKAFEAALGRLKEGKTLQ